MAFRQNWVLILCCFAVALQPGTGYETYYVESDCRYGNITLSLESTGSASAVLLAVSEQSSSYSIAMDCRMDFSAPPGHKIVVAIRELGFRTDFDGSCKDYLMIDNYAKCEVLFRLEEERHFTSHGNTLELLYHISQDKMNNSTLTGYAGLKLTVTAVQEGSECPSTENRFRCRNSFCVWSGLHCDTHNNCGDLSDEVDCSPSGGRTTIILIIIGVLILLLLVIMCVATLVCSKNESVRRFSSRLRSRTISYLPKRFSR